MNKRTELLAERAVSAQLGEKTYRVVYHFDDGSHYIDEYGSTKGLQDTLRELVKEIDSNMRKNERVERVDVSCDGIAVATRSRKGLAERAPSPDTTTLPGGYEIVDAFPSEAGANQYAKDFARGGKNKVKVVDLGEDAGRLRYAVFVVGGSSVLSALAAKRPCTNCGEDMSQGVGKTLGCLGPKGDGDGCDGEFCSVRCLEEHERKTGHGEKELALRRDRVALAAVERQLALGRCECSDSGCPAHSGKNRCSHQATIVLYRSDMEDRTGTAFCDKCAEDALDSGVFTDEN